MKQIIELFSVAVGKDEPFFPVFFQVDEGF